MPTINNETLGAGKKGAFDKQKDSAARREYSKLYNSRRWRGVSKRFRNNNPLCVQCEKDGRTTAAAVTDHIKPHRGNLELFWDESNWQALCHSCHNSKSGRERWIKSDVD